MDKAMGGGARTGTGMGVGVGTPAMESNAAMGIKIGDAATGVRGRVVGVIGMGIPVGEVRTVSRTRRRRAGETAMQMEMERMTWRGEAITLMEVLSATLATGGVSGTAVVMAMLVLVLIVGWEREQTRRLEVERAIATAM
jgi:hypothetical protein